NEAHGRQHNRPAGRCHARGRIFGTAVSSCPTRSADENGVGTVRATRFPAGREGFMPFALPVPPHWSTRGPLARTLVDPQQEYLAFACQLLALIKDGQGDS